MRSVRMLAIVGGYLLVLLLSGCISLPTGGHPAVIKTLEEVKDLRFLEILSARRLWQPERVGLEGHDSVWCVTAYGENDEDEFEVYLWVTQDGESWTAVIASDAGFEKMGCER